MRKIIKDNKQLEKLYQYIVNGMEEKKETEPILDRDEFFHMTVRGYEL